MQVNRRRGLIFASLAIVFGFAASSLFFIRLNELERELGPRQSVVVATEYIPAGTVISRTVLSTIDMPQMYVRNNYLQDLSQAIGRVPVVDIMSQDVVRHEVLLTRDEPEPGMRAVAIPVSADTAVGGSLLPGNRVDVIVSYSVEADEEVIQRTELLLENVEVFAIGSATPGLGPALALPLDTLLSDPANGAGQTFQTVTLLMDVEDALHLTYMLNFGLDVRLALRALSDEESSGLVGQTVTNESFSPEDGNDR